MKYQITLTFKMFSYCYKQFIFFFFLVGWLLKLHRIGYISSCKYVINVFKFFIEFISMTLVMKII